MFSIRTVCPKDTKPILVVYLKSKLNLEACIFLGYTDRPAWEAPTGI